jgi:hypothetical protein
MFKLHRGSAACNTGAAASAPALFQQLSSEFPEIPRRVVGEVLNRTVHPGASPDGTFRLVRQDTSARAMLEAIRLRSVAGAQRIGLATRDDAVVVRDVDPPGPSTTPSRDWRAASGRHRQR